MRAPHAMTVFLSAFLLFLVQPLIGRYILPWYGGYAGIWSVMMVFFQTTLLAGYIYAHLMSTRLRPGGQAAVHVILLGLAVAMLPIEPGPALKPAADAEPIWSILGLLCRTVGIPYFVVSTTGPLIQAWYARVHPGKSPYALYALSNAGSLLALLAYPAVVEPFLGRHEQALVWSGGFFLFAALCAATALSSRRSPVPPTCSQPAADQRPNSPRRGRVYAMWIGLPALASTLLLAMTNELCVDVASAPFLWVLPLGCYLLSFIVAFSGQRELHRGIWYPLAFAAMLLMPNKQAVPFQFTVALYAAALFVLCSVLHGETYRLRPEAKRLTEFYLCVSLGGVIGGVFVGIIAPLLFTSYLELRITLIACVAILSILPFAGASSMLSAIRTRKALFAVLLSANFVLLVLVGAEAMRNHGKAVHRSRNFYGTYAVTEFEVGSKRVGRILSSGTTEHGVQYLEPALQVIPTRYYTRQSGVGIALAASSDRPIRVGVIGLGAGTLAAYGKEGDSYSFYEINPECLRIAQTYFTFLENSRAKVDIRLGDARLNLEQEEAHGFDVLVLDAFTSDAIPVHLLTAEAFETYRRHLAPGGVICANISNRHLELAPVLKAVGALFKMPAFLWSAGEGRGVSGSACDYVILGGDENFMNSFERQARFIREKFTPAGQSPEQFTRRASIGQVRDVRPWTDDFSNLFSVLKPLKF